MKQTIAGTLKFVPLPVLMIGTYDENGNPNLMNAAWGGQCGRNNISISLSPHKTTDNILIKKEFTVAYATKDTLVASDYFGIESGNNVVKIAKAGFHAVQSEKVDAPVFEEYPLTLECRLLKSEEEFGELRIVAEVVGMVAEESILDAEGKIDFDKLLPISYDPTHNTYRVLGENVGLAFKDGLTIKNA